MNHVIQAQLNELEGAHVAEHKHGEMDIADHEKTFEGFVKFVAWAVIIILVAIPETMVILGFVVAAMILLML